MPNQEQSQKKLERLLEKRLDLVSEGSGGKKIYALIQPKEEVLGEGTIDQMKLQIGKLTTEKEELIAQFRRNYAEYERNHNAAIKTIDDSILELTKLIDEIENPTTKDKSK